LKICLGTSQFGSKYGVTNKSGATTIDEISKILSFAKKNHLNQLDLAYNYGNSIEKLGKFNLSGFELIYKLPSLSDGFSLKDYKKIIEDTLDALGCNSFYCIMLHNSNDLQFGNYKKLLELLESFVVNGISNKIGVSIYTEQQALASIKLDVFELIQLPLNVFDQRFSDERFFNEFDNSRKIEFHARSIFLQGLLLAHPKNLPNYFLPWQKYFENWEKFCDINQLNRIEASLKFASQQRSISSLVLGVETLNQLKEINNYREINNNFEFSHLSVDDENIILPFNWKID